jgi:hypothetical protein
MKGIYKFSYDSGAGELHGLFVAEKSEVESAIGKELCFGEVLGKHSEVIFQLAEEDIEELSIEHDEVEMMLGLVEKYNLQTGYNPLNYLPDEDMNS